MDNKQWKQEYLCEPINCFDAKVTELYEEIGRMNFRTAKEKRETIMILCDKRKVVYSDLVAYDKTQAAKPHNRCGLTRRR